MNMTAALSRLMHSPYTLRGEPRIKLFSDKKGVTVKHYAPKSLLLPTV
jgi:hypothetical protein